jgi:hypothetical protein
MDVPRLRHSATVRCFGRKLVALYYDYIGVGVGEHTGSQETRHASAEHQGPVTTCFWHPNLLGSSLEVGPEAYSLTRS